MSKPKMPRDVIQKRKGKEKGRRKHLKKDIGLKSFTFFFFSHGILGFVDLIKQL